MSVISARFRTPLSTALLSAFAAAALTVGAHAQSPAANNQMALTKMSHEATRILNDVGMAQAAVSSGQKAAAIRDIHMAMNVRDHLAMTAHAHNLPEVVPIFSELEQSTALGEVVAHKNNGQPLKPATAPVTVDNISDQFTFIGIDLDKTKAHLQAASQALQSNNTQAAEQALSAVGDELVVAKMSADSPLLAVRENLAIAQRALRQSQDKEATGALQQASVELTAYAQQSGNPHQQAAQTLKTAIDHMLADSSQRKPAAAAKVGTWWTEVNSWMQVPPAA